MKTAEGWAVCYEGRKYNGVTELKLIRLHPNDAKMVDEVFTSNFTRNVEFVIQTIATGTSEFDIQDEDVAVLVPINKQIK